VIVSQRSDDTRPFVLAAFSEQPFAFPGDRAQFDPLGCRTGQLPPSDGGVFVPAGTFTITTGTWSKVFDAQADRRYVYREEAAAAVEPPVVASFTGATVPAFSATLPVVDDLGVTIDGCSCSFSACSPIARAQPLVLRWKPGRGDVVLRLATTSAELFCRFSGAQGSATVPAVELQKVSGSAVVEAGSFSSGQTVAGAYRVALRIYRQSIEGRADVR
jgi:hypothetical protein